MGREVVCSKAMAKIQCQTRVCNRSCLDYEEMVASRVSVAAQSRDPLPGLGYVSGLCG